MKRSSGFSASEQLFALIRHVADQAPGDEPLSDAAIGRMVGFEPARTSRWKHGLIAVDDAGRLQALSQTFSIDISVLCHVAAGYLTAAEALEILSNIATYLRFLGEQIMLPGDGQILFVTDAEGTEARIERTSMNTSRRTVRRPAGGRSPSRKDMERLLLLADDDPATREMVNHMTGRGTGVTVLMAGSLEEALFLSGRHRPHLVLLDLFLPGADGFSVVRLLSNRDQSEARVIVLSRLTTQDIVRRARGCGAEQVVEKPLRVRQLGRIIREL